MPITQKRNLVKLFFVAGSLLLLAGILLAGKPANADADSYQYPCSPYTVGGYNFGTYVSGWGYHTGQDIACSAGTPVYAVADGTVMYSARTPASYRWGNLILIQHQNPSGSQITSLYGHLSDDRRVSAGQNVHKGQLIGFVGPAWSAQNGNWGDHLHFAMHPGAYHASVGTYAPDIVGYVGSTATLATWVNPGNYINTHQVSYDYQVVSFTGPQSHGKYETYQVEINLRNTGTATWHSEDFRLGTSSPKDRHSGFSKDMIGSGWISAARIYLTHDTAPGDVGTFLAVFKNSYVAPGRYFEHFTPLVEGEQWLRDKGITMVQEVRPPVFSDQLYSHAATTTFRPTSFANPVSTRYLLPGEQLSLKALYRNNGDTSWHVGGNRGDVVLATAAQRNRYSRFYTAGDADIDSSENWASPTRPSLIDGRYDPETKSVVADDKIMPGEIAVFSFTVTAPRTSGTYTEHFSPAIEGIRWLPDVGLSYKLRVLPPGLHYEYSRHDSPEPIELAGGEAETHLYLRNSGQQSWPVNGDLVLGTDRARDHVSPFRTSDWVSANRASRIDVNASDPDKTTVDPGEVARFDFSITNPTRPDGTYPEYFRPAMTGVKWLPENYGIYIPVTVKSAPLRDEYVTYTTDKPTNSLHWGDQVTATLVMRNLGSEEWTGTGDRQTILATINPEDRTSRFANDTWLTPSRPTKVTGRVTDLSPLTVDTSVASVKQGQLAAFRVNLTVPSGLAAGNYKEYFNLAIADLVWFDDLGLYFPLTVVGP